MNLEIPAGVAEAQEITAGIDRVLQTGFSRVGKVEKAALDALAAAVGATPLGLRVAEAANALAGGELLAHHLAMVASARMAVEGARFDALFETATTAAGLLVVRPAEETEPIPIDAELMTLMESARQWLVEIALAGFGQLDHNAVAPAIGALRPIQDSPPLRRLASLLTGFVFELLEATPTAALECIPSRRWGDLWCQAILATFVLPARPQHTTIAGQLTPLGVDIRHHDRQLSVVVHSLLETDSRRLVRTTLSAWKVDAVAGDEIWQLLLPLAPALLDALVKPATLTLEGHTLLDTGDLLWDGSRTSKANAAPWQLSLAGASVNPPMARDRHPAALAVPLLSDEVSAAGTISFGRVSPHAHLDEAAAHSAKSLFGLIRFDEHFEIQPLALLCGRKTRGPAEGIAAAKKIKKPALAILKERASRLLRS